MTYFMTKRSHFRNLPAALPNFKTWYGKDFTDISVIMANKKDKFYVCIIWITKSYNTLKSHKKHAHMELIF